MTILCCILLPLIYLAVFFLMAFILGAFKEKFLYLPEHVIKKSKTIADIFLVAGSSCMIFTVFFSPSSTAILVTTILVGLAGFITSALLSEDKDEEYEEYEKHEC